MGKKVISILRVLRIADEFFKDKMSLNQISKKENMSVQDVMMYLYKSYEYREDIKKVEESEKNGFNK